MPKLPSPVGKNTAKPINLKQVTVTATRGTKATAPVVKNNVGTTDAYKARTDSTSKANLMADANLRAARKTRGY